MNDTENGVFPEIQEVIISQDQILEKVRQIGGQIATDYQYKNPLFIGVLKGVLFFMADLMRSVPYSCEVDFLAISNYNTDARKKGMVRLVKDLDIPINGRDVVFVEDVIDTGLTLNYILKNLRDRSPASLEVCVLFNKPAHRLIEIPIKYKGFDLPDRFVVGYGLDHHEKYRNLPYVGLLKGDAIHLPHFSGD
ncbi:MAG: hypoxanthine phosphoribosyltransferase [Chloroflexi bacterium HGW-Chloroflexi-10]|nr:MAG: hypoxanthine phosphoribosyltransferase [Chloroflexi bacterium HGW-Chloroflexi-10]